MHVYQMWVTYICEWEMTEQSYKLLNSKFMESVVRLLLEVSF